MQIPYGQKINPTTYQKICKPEHFMKKYQGFGISETVLNILQYQGIKIIQIIYVGKTETKAYVTTTKKYIESQKKHLNGENDKQKFLSITELTEQ